MKMSKGLYEVIVSKNISLDQKVEAVNNFTVPVHNLDTGIVEPPELLKEDAELIIEALENDNVEDMLNGYNFQQVRRIILDLMARLFPEGSMKFSHDTLPKKLIDDAVEEIESIYELE